MLRGYIFGPDPPPSLPCDGPSPAEGSGPSIIDSDSGGLAVSWGSLSLSLSGHEPPFLSEILHPLHSTNNTRFTSDQDHACDIACSILVANVVLCGGIFGQEGGLAQLVGFWI